ncbi:MAG: TetR/AcrR family transcriptional regulator [Rubrimonas sp.]
MDDPKPARGGRPPRLTAEARAACVMQAMEAVIAERGLHGASMDAIAMKAGMSKRTVYALFPSRDALFAAWAEAVRELLVRPLAPEECDLPLLDRLRRMLGREVERAASESRLHVLRALIAEAPRHPAIARAFHDAIPMAARRLLAAELTRAVARGEIDVPDPDAAAALLLDMTCVNPIAMLLNPDAGPVCRQTAADRLDLALNVFLHGVARRP